MFLSSWSIFLGKALYAVAGGVEYAEESMIASLAHFAARWGGFDAHAFQRALGGDVEDRLLALFAFGHLQPGPIGHAVTPFLDSSFPKERWASTITLGRWKNEEILPHLLELLEEGLVYTPPVESKEDGHARQQWDLEDARYQQEYEWYRHQRQDVALVLASWQHPSVIPALIQTFADCYHQELHSQAAKDCPFLCVDWQKFQDCLAYALGQQRAWDAPDSLSLSPERLHIMRMFMAYGALHANTPHILAGMWYQSYEEMGIIRPDQIDEILQAQFHLSPEVCATYYRDFLRYCADREDPHRRGH